MSTRYLVFVYGTLKQGFSNHDVMTAAGGRKIDRAVLFDHCLIHIGGFPGLIPGGDTGVLGELYSVENLEPLDCLEGYSEDDETHSMYLRRLVRALSLGFGDEVECWTYIWNRDTERYPVIESGVFVG